MRGHFNGTLRLTRFMLRRERVTSALWVLGLSAFSTALLPAVDAVISTPAEREALVQALVNPAMTAMMGPLYSQDTGGLFAYMMLLWTMLAVGVMSAFLVVRHTRADEERGRAEVIRSLPVGRMAVLGAALTTAAAVNVAIALLTGLGMAATGIGGVGLAACMLYGALLGAFGLVCSALAAVASQLCAGSRGALGLSTAAIIVMYVVRAIGDVPDEAGAASAEWLSLASPMGLLQRSQALHGNHWWPVLFASLAAAALAALAMRLSRARDMDRGFMPARRGRPKAAGWLLSPMGLSWRLLRGPVLVWSASMTALGAAYGAIMGDVGAFIESNEFYGDLMIDAPG
ncbi:MAG: ABC transporter permease, partial [Oscillospiraceae bacterium]|nr:ABC transporter permease [Oscillospiraceae bacterium]